MIIGVLATIALGAAGGFYFLNDGTPVTTASIERGDVRFLIEETGRIDSRHRVMLKTSVADTVQTVTVKIGDEVTEGDVLVELDHKLLDSQIEGIEAQLRNVELQLMEALEPKDQSLINQASAAVRQARIAYEQALEDLSVQKKLYE